MRECPELLGGAAPRRLAPQTTILSQPDALSRPTSPQPLWPAQGLPVGRPCSAPARPTRCGTHYLGAGLPCGAALGPAPGCRWETEFVVLWVLCLYS